VSEWDRVVATSTQVNSVNVVFTEVRRYTSEAYIRTVWSVRPSLLNPLTRVPWVGGVGYPWRGLKGAQPRSS
jgi:hypothetical protein